MWRNIRGRYDFPDRVIVRLECGHKAIIHKKVPQYNGELYSWSQVAVFCTQCPFTPMPEIDDGLVS